ncbi:MAG: hypothetical protein IIB21_07680, partial [Chloroflexi bacterium]|nr:hypothetical protein [Chloroflexota bacterium]
MARAAAKEFSKVVDDDLLAKALASAVTRGDIVNFRLLFGAFSPGRESSTEAFETEKYGYLQPDEDTSTDSEFQRAIDLVRDDATWSHIKKELEARRPAQLPSVLLLPLADNAVRHGKYSNAAQAYELLRIRRRMQDAFVEEGGKALDAGDTATAATAFLISV